MKDDQRRENNNNIINFENKSQEKSRDVKSGDELSSGWVKYTKKKVVC
jgi:hypothetical protein